MMPFLQQVFRIVGSPESFESTLKRNNATFALERLH